MTDEVKSQSSNLSVPFISKVTDFSGKLINRLKSSKLSSFGKFGKKKAVIIVAVILLIVGGIFWWKSNSNSSVQTSDIPSYVSQGDAATINKRFTVPIRDKEGKPSGTDLVVNVSTMERTNNLIYKGRQLTPKEGKDFLVINLEIENSTNNRLTVRPVDFFRLVGDDGKNYAPDIQTDPVTVEPLSSKNTRTIY